MSTSLVNRLEDIHRALDAITGEVAPRCGCMGRSCQPDKPEVVNLLDDIEAAAKFIRAKLSPCPT